jgi:hypothetical protein
VTEEARVTVACADGSNCLNTVSNSLTAVERAKILPDDETLDVPTEKLNNIPTCVQSSEEANGRVEENSLKFEAQEQKIRQLEHFHEEMRRKIENLEIERKRDLKVLKEKEESFRREREEMALKFSQTKELYESEKYDSSAKEKEILITRKERAIVEREAQLVLRDERISQTEETILQKDELIARKSEEVAAVHTFLFHSLCSHVLLSYRLATDVDVQFDRPSLLLRLIETKVPIEEWTNEILIAIEKHNIRNTPSKSIMQKKKIAASTTTHFKTFL